MIEIHRLTKSFKGCSVLKDVSLKIDKKKYALLGINGAGKTTFIKIIIGVMKPDLGSVYYNSTNIVDKPREYQTKIGYMAQYSSYYPDYRICDYLDYICCINDMKRSKRIERVRDVLEDVNMWQYRNKRIKELSGGMKQRVGVAQAIINYPEIIIMDEPTAGLDPNERIRFRELVDRISENKTVIIATHDIDDAYKIADEIILLHNCQFQRIENESTISKAYFSSSSELESFFYKMTSEDEK